MQLLSKCRKIVNKPINIIFEMFVKRIFFIVQYNLKLRKAKMVRLVTGFSFVYFFVYKNVFFCLEKL